MHLHTIDPFDAKDHDDAISIARTPQGYRLGVHIADVSFYVNEGSALDAAALERGNSVYLPGMVIPMLPEVLSNDVCSLRPNRRRLAHSVIMDFDRHGKVLGWRIMVSRVKHFKTIPYSPDQDLRVTEELEGEVSRQEIGTEVREGHPTILYEVTTKQGERVDGYYQWIATDIHFPMKLAKKDGSWIVEYQHVSMRSVSNYLFNLPINFQPLEEFNTPGLPDQTEPGL